MERRYLLTWLLLAAATSALGACGGESLPPTDEPVVVTAVDYGFEGLPEKVKAGTTLTLVNESMVELHELVAIRLPDDETRAADELVQLPPDELAAFFPLVETVIIAPPEQAGFPVEGVGVLDEPGRYLIICAIPTGANPDEYLAAAAATEGGPPDVAGGPPHLAMGMYAEVTVDG
jgi:plastocyanin